MSWKDPRFMPAPIISFTGISHSQHPGAVSFPRLVLGGINHYWRYEFQGTDLQINLVVVSPLVSLVP